MSWMRTVSLATVAALTIPLWQAPGAEAVALPDLVVRDSGILTPITTAGAKVTVVSTVVNNGLATAPSSRLRYVLSTDGHLDAHDRQLVGIGVVPGIQPHKAVFVSALVTLPSPLAARPYRLFICADAARTVTETNEANNCTDVEPLTVKAAAAPLTNVTPVLGTSEFTDPTTVAKKGGRVTASDAHALYVLVIPPGALGRDEKITMTPLANVTGLPFSGGMRYGVKLEPEGLELAKPAALLIYGAGAATKANDVFFGFHGAGKALTLVPRFRTRPSLFPTTTPANSMYIPIQHFSGYGVAPATSQEVATQLRRGAASAADALSQQATAELRPGGNLVAIPPLIDRYAAEVLLPEAAAAAFSDAMYERAVYDWLAFERMSQLIGYEPYSAATQAVLAQVEGLMKAAWQALVTRAEARCRVGDFSIIGKILPLERLLQLNGGGVKYAGNGDANDFARITARCWHFQLHVTVRAVKDADTPGVIFNGVGLEGHEHWAFTGAATVPLALKVDGVLGAAGRLAGTGALLYTERRYAGSGKVAIGNLVNSCTTSFGGQTRAGQVTVADGSILQRPNGPLEPYMTVTIGQPQELVKTACSPFAADPPTEWQTNLLNSWRGPTYDESAADHSTTNPDNGPWTFHLTPGHHPIVGTLSRVVTHADLGLTVTITMALVHTPQ